MNIDLSDFLPFGSISPESGMMPRQNRPLGGDEPRPVIALKLPIQRINLQRARGRCGSRSTCPVRCS